MSDTNSSMKKYTLVIRIPILALYADASLDYGHGIAGRSITAMNIPGVLDDESRDTEVEVEDYEK